MKNKLIVPVTYLGGTGGNFLSWFLNLAYHNDKQTVMTFSEHGNAHASPYACHGDNNRQMVDDEIKINDIIQQAPQRYPKSIWYPNIHLKNLSLAALTFEKVIRITLDRDDFDTIISIMTGKVRLDLNMLKPEEITQENFNRKQGLEQWVHMYQVEPFGNVLFVSFKEMMYNSEIELVNKLSKFTKIPIENFNTQNLTLWRNKTNQGINEVNKYRN